MKKIQKMTYVLVKASDGNPIVAIATVMLFFIMFNMLEALIETLIFGHRFEHWLDVIFILAFIAYSGYATWMCAVFHEAKKPN